MQTTSLLDSEAGWFMYMKTKERKVAGMDRFFTQEHCDRCGGSLEDGRIMSMYNTDCICMECKKKERQRADYHDALEADRAQVKTGNYNFSGVGLR